MANRPRVGYVVKRYPCFSETFIINEILAHEEAGLELEIFALRPTVDTHFQDALARVRSAVNYLEHKGIAAEELWSALDHAGLVLPGFWGKMDICRWQSHRDVYQAVTLAVEVVKKDIRHLHAHFGTSAAGVARLASRLAGITYSFTAHAKDIFHQDVSPRDLRARLADAAGVVTVSDYNLRFLRERYGDAAGRVTRIYNGLDLERFSFAAPAARATAIVAVGRLIEKKGFGDLIEACSLLVNKGTPVDCLIIGTGELQEKLANRIRECRLENHVRLLGPRPQRDVIGYLRSAAMFVAPCVVASDGNQDGLPTVLLEAMALGVPCVSTDVTGIPEVIVDRKTGLMVPQNNPRELSLAIAELMRDDDLRVNLARRARELVEEKFDIRKNAGFMREYFEKIITGPALGRPSGSPREEAGRGNVPPESPDYV